MASQSIGDLDRRLHYYNAIIESDSGNYNELRKHRTALKKQTKEMDSKRKELTLLNQQMIKEKNSLLAKIQSDKEFLQKIHEEQTLLEQRAGQLRKSSQYLQDKIQNLTSAREQIRKDAQEGKSTSIIPTGKKILPGTLSWPIKGKFRTERPFGKIKSGMATIFNPGLDLTTEGDISVYASEDGIIFYKGTPAGSSSTYGKVVMIAHGDYDGKFITLYGNLSTILVALNQTVKKGEKIATIAAKDYLGSPSTPRLHYQVRVNGEPKDPAQWLEKR
jgi:septal ring factor EnvC (AmiA/AmiB activator)